MGKSLAFALRARRADVPTAKEAGMINRPDREHLEFATGSRRVLLSYNVGDFCELHQELLYAGRSHAGIVVSHQQQYPLKDEIRALSV